MVDLYHMIGNDLNHGSSGDLQSVDGTIQGQQRVLRRLLTSPGTYIWQTDYGGGLPALVGQTLDTGAITAVIRNQLALEAVVASDPAPVIMVHPIANGVFVTISYVDADNGAQTTLNFNLP
jgi:phage baseplate assembly protein W